MYRHYLLILLGITSALLFLSGFSGCSQAPDYWKEAGPGQKKVLVSFPPLYCLTHAVAGNDAYVLCMLSSQGPHDYQQSMMDMNKVKDADLFIYNGLSLDDVFVDKMLRASSNKTLAKLNLGEGIHMKNPALLLKGEEHEDADGNKHSHGDFDPHIWLDPKMAQIMTELIRDQLIALDPTHKTGYETRAAQLIDELKKLDEHGKNAFKDKKNKTIVTMHESLGYFAKAFGLKIAGSIQVMPGTDPDSGTLARLMDLSQKEGVRVFAVEPQYSSGQAETLQRSLKQKHKIDVQIVLIDPLETAPIPRGNWINPDPAYYLTKMRENIDTLAKALP